MSRAISTLRSVLALAIVLIVADLAAAHDVWATGVTVCVNGPSGYGPYVNWTLQNDWPNAGILAYVIISSQTSLGAPPQSFYLQPYRQPGDSRSGILQAWSASTTIRGTTDWNDTSPNPNWAKTVTLAAPANCARCVSPGQQCGSQAGLPVCQGRVCAADNSCGVQPIASDARCPVRQGVAGGAPMCTQQSCVGGACVTGPYDDPACAQTPLPAGVSAECNRMACVGTTCQPVPWFFPSSAPLSTPTCTGASPAPACNRYVCTVNATGGAASCGLQADPALANTVCDDDNNLCTSQKCVVDPRTNTASCSVATQVDCGPAEAAKCLGAGVCVPSTGECAFPAASDFTNCYSGAVNDPNCTDYQCFRGACVRNCLCGNGILDEGETCDWGADAWCPLPPHDAKDCPAGLQPGNNGAGNHLGLNDSLSWCNASCVALNLHRHGGMSAGAIAGAAVGAAAGATLLAGAAFLLYRHSLGQRVGSNYATSEMHGRAHNNPTFASPTLASSNPHYVQMT